MTPARLLGGSAPWVAGLSLLSACAAFDPSYGVYDVDLKQRTISGTVGADSDDANVEHSMLFFCRTDLRGAQLEDVKIRRHANGVAVFSAKCVGQAPA